jgi:hypothetical protein
LVLTLNLRIESIKVAARKALTEVIWLLRLDEPATIG